MYVWDYTQEKMLRRVITRFQQDVGANGYGFDAMNMIVSYFRARSSGFNHAQFLATEDLASAPPAEEHADLEPKILHDYVSTVEKEQEMELKNFTPQTTWTPIPDLSPYTEYAIYLNWPLMMCWIIAAVIASIWTSAFILVVTMDVSRWLMRSTWGLACGLVRAVQNAADLFVWAVLFPCRQLRDRSIGLEVVKGFKPVATMSEAVTITVTPPVIPDARIVTHLNEVQPEMALEGTTHVMADPPSAIVAILGYDEETDTTGIHGLGVIVKIHTPSGLKVVLMSAKHVFDTWGWGSHEYSLGRIINGNWVRVPYRNMRILSMTTTSDIVLSEILPGAVSGLEASPLEVAVPRLSLVTYAYGHHPDGFHRSAGNIAKNKDIVNGLLYTGWTTAGYSGTPYVQRRNGKYAVVGLHYGAHKTEKINLGFNAGMFAGPSFIAYKSAVGETSSDETATLSREDALIVAQDFAHRHNLPPIYDEESGEWGSESTEDSYDETKAKFYIGGEDDEDEQHAEIHRRRERIEGYKAAMHAQQGRFDLGGQRGDGGHGETTLNAGQLFSLAPARPGLLDTRITSTQPNLGPTLVPSVIDVASPLATPSLLPRKVSDLELPEELKLSGLLILEPPKVPLSQPLELPAISKTQAEAESAKAQAARLQAQRAEEKMELKRRNTALAEQKRADAIARRAENLAKADQAKREAELKRRWLSEQKSKTKPKRTPAPTQVAPEQVQGAALAPRVQVDYALFQDFLNYRNTHVLPSSQPSSINGPSVDPVMK